MRKPISANNLPKAKCSSCKRKNDVDWIIILEKKKRFQHGDRTAQKHAVEICFLCAQEWTVERLPVELRRYELAALITRKTFDRSKGKRNKQESNSN